MSGVWFDKDEGFGFFLTEGHDRCLYLEKEKEYQNDVTFYDTRTSKYNYQISSDHRIVPPELTS